MKIAANLKSLGRVTLILGTIATALTIFGLQGSTSAQAFQLTALYGISIFCSSLFSGMLFLGLGAILEQLNRIGDSLEVEKKATAQEVEGAGAGVRSATAHD